MEFITRFANLYRMPSQFCRDLKKLASSSVSDDFVLAIWKDYLPTNMQYVLTALRITEANALIEVADTIHDIRPEPGQIADMMCDRLCRFEAQINARRPRSHSRRRRSYSWERTLQTGLCYYHEIFRDRARKCRTPCSWNGGKRHQPSVNAACDDGSGSRRIFITDRNFRISFFVDTGADLCVYPLNKLRGPATEAVPIKTIIGESTYHRLRAEFPNLTRPSVFGREKTRHGMVHHMKTTLGPLVFSKPRRLAPDRFKQVKTGFGMMMEQGVMRLSKSPWASPLHVALWRLPCVERPHRTRQLLAAAYRRLCATSVR